MSLVQQQQQPEQPPQREPDGSTFTDSPQAQQQKQQPQKVGEKQQGPALQHGASIAERQPPPQQQQQKQLSPCADQTAEFSSSSSNDDARSTSACLSASAGTASSSSCSSSSSSSISSPPQTRCLDTGSEPAAPAVETAFAGVIAKALVEATPSAAAEETVAQKEQTTTCGVSNGAASATRNNKAGTNSPPKSAAKNNQEEWYVVLTADALSVLLQATTTQAALQRQQHESGSSSSSKIDNNTSSSSDIRTSRSGSQQPFLTGGEAATRQCQSEEKPKKKDGVATQQAEEKARDAAAESKAEETKKTAPLSLSLAAATAGDEQIAVASGLSRFSDAETALETEWATPTQEQQQRKSPQLFETEAKTSSETAAVDWTAKTEGGCPVGPLSVEVLRVYLERCLIDGYSLCWRNSMPTWKPLGEIEELKTMLAAAEEIEEEEEGSTDAFFVQQLQQRRELERRRPRGVVGERKALTAVAAELKYTTPEGDSMVFDETDRQWRTTQEYELLLLLAEAGGGEEAQQQTQQRRATVAAAAATAAENAARIEVAKTETLPASSSAAQGGVVVEEGGGDEESAKKTEKPSSDDISAEQLKKQLNAEKRRLYRQRQKRKREQGEWVSSKKNPNVYVTGLPPDCTVEELAELFRKAGVFKIEPETLKPKIRIYCDPNTGLCKGDALLSFVHEDSVAIAIKYFDNTALRSAGDRHILKVQRAEFSGGARGEKEQQEGNLKESSNNKAVLPAASGHSKTRFHRLLDKKKYLAAKYEQERLLSWGDAVDDGTGRRIVVMKPVYSTEEATRFEEGDEFYEELRRELHDEIAHYATPEKVTVIPRHVQGLACVKLKTFEDAERIIEQFRGRYFDGRQLDVFFYDGKTDLKANCLPSRRAAEKGTGKQRLSTEVHGAVGVTRIGAECAGGLVAKRAATTSKEQQVESVSESKRTKPETFSLQEKPLEEEASSSSRGRESEEDAEDEAEQRLQQFGDWVEEQSSEEEFEVQTEESGEIQ